MKKYFPLFLLAIAPFTQANIEVHGHRGARAVLPENTLPAFKHAMEVGADVLELDLQVTKDNHLIITHDPYVNHKICRPPKGVKAKKHVIFRQLTLKEVKSYDCGSLKNPRFPEQKPVPGEKIPTLEELFEMVKNSPLPQAKKVHFNIETKIIPGEPTLSPTPEAFVQKILSVLKKHKMLKRTILQSFDHRTLRIAKSKVPHLRVAPLLAYSLPDLVSLAKNLKAEIISSNQKWITAVEVKKLHRKKIKVIPWTANTEKEWHRLVDLNVDGIITDHPQALIQFLKKRGLRK